MYFNKYSPINFKVKRMGLMLACLLGCQGLKAQSTVPLGDLSFFQEPSSNWKLAANVHADLGEDEALLTKDGTGILINLAGTKNAKDLYTKATYGDMDLELDYMMAKGSNSGIYLQGRYEIQLLDSWGTVNPKSGDNGGIYERWDESNQMDKKGMMAMHPGKMPAGHRVYGSISKSHSRRRALILPGKKSAMLKSLMLN